MTPQAPLSQSLVDGLADALNTAATSAVIQDGSLKISKTVGLQAALDSKQATIVNNSLQTSHVSGLQTALNNEGGNTSGPLRHVGPATFTGNLTVTNAFYAGSLETGHALLTPAIVAPSSADLAIRNYLDEPWEL